ncbi:SHOCT domain-containing protein [Marinomonas gallaica]|uniref:SHOCT domain-containing protein n=1 Tax=Marinomonas gallaica TaxID=1806667 RepID=UPI003A8FBFD8
MENDQVEIIEDNSETVKLLTFGYFILGLIIPFWIITLPLFWFLAYRDYKSPNGKPLFSNQPTAPAQTAKVVTPTQNFEALEKLNELKEKGILTEDEYNREKSKILNS